MRELWKRLGLAWHVLRGKPLIYKVIFEGGFVLGGLLDDDTWVVGCTFLEEKRKHRSLMQRLRTWFMWHKLYRMHKRHLRERNRRERDG